MAKKGNQGLLRILKLMVNHKTCYCALGKFGNFQLLLFMSVSLYNYNYFLNLCTHTYTVIGTDATVSSPSPLSIEQLTMQPSHLPLNYNADSGEDADDEAATRLLLPIKCHSLYSLYRSISSSDQGMKSSATSHAPSAPNNLSPVKPLSPHLFSSDSSQVL